MQWHGETTEDWITHPGSIEAKGAEDQTNAATEGAAFEGLPDRRGESVKTQFTSGGQDAEIDSLSIHVMSILLFFGENLHGCNKVAKGVGRGVGGMKLMRRGYG